MYKGHVAPGVDIERVGKCSVCRHLSCQRRACHVGVTTGIHSCFVDNGCLNEGVSAYIIDTDVVVPWRVVESLKEIERFPTGRDGIEGEVSVQRNCPRQSSRLRIDERDGRLIDALSQGAQGQPLPACRENRSIVACSCSGVGARNDECAHPGSALSINNGDCRLTICRCGCVESLVIKRTQAIRQ